MDKVADMKQNKEDSMNTYDVYDVKEKCNLMTNSTAIEIAERFNINKRKVYNHQHGGYLLEQRYLININTKGNESFKKQWDRARFKINPSARRG